MAKEVWVTLIVGILVLASVFYVYSTNVSVHAVRVFVQYDVSGGGYLGSNIDTDVKPFHVVYGASSYGYPGFKVGGIKQESIQLSLTSNASDVHKITSIQTKTFGFTIISLKPSTPISVPAGTSALLITLIVQSPFLGYDGDLELTIVTV